MHTRIRDAALRGAFCALILLALFASGLATDTPKGLEAAGCNADETIDSEEQAFLKLINQHRAADGRAPLGLSYTLSRAASWKSNDLGVNRYFAHDDLDRSWSQRIRDCGYRYNTYLGENIAAGVSSAQSAFDMWRNSSGHNANMLGANYATIGIGRAYVAGSPYGWYWTTEFGGVDDGYATIADPTPLEPLPQPGNDGEGDTTPPSLTLSASVHGSTVSITARAQDEGGISRVEFRSNGVLVKADTRAPYTLRVPVQRSITVEARAYDGAGNVTTKTVDAHPKRR